jgi:hypothetical protein
LVSQNARAFVADEQQVWLPGAQWISLDDDIHRGEQDFSHLLFGDELVQLPE